jgi:hypothetical protein
LEGEGGGGRGRKEKPWVGRRVFVPPPSCSIISEASEAVCIPHAISFGLPDTNEVVCIPHTILFGLLDANKVVCIPHTVSFGLPHVNEQCAAHTLLCSSSFIPHHLGGILSSNSKNKAA